MAWAAVAAAGLQVAGSLQQGRAAAGAHTYNAQALEQRAGYTQAQANADALEYLRDQRRTMGTARAARGASGVVPSTGSAFLTDQDMQREMLFQAAKIRRGGEVEAQRLRQQAGLERYGARAAKTSGLLGGGGALLSGFSNLYQGS